jgi:hypothetical protein
VAKITKWPEVATKARKLRKLGLSYSEVARQLGGKISKQAVWFHLKAEGL